MKAAYYDALGTASDVLKIGELDTPTPGPGEVLVRLSVSGVNPSDWKARWRGRLGAMPFPRIVPQSDGAGIIEAVGEGVDQARVGEAVWVHNGQWKRAFGTAAQYIATTQDHVIAIPDGVDPAEAACFGIPFLTAHRAVSIDGDVEGQTLLVTGGAGAVGHYVVQIAKAKRARVITTVSSAEKAEYVRAAGADEVINYRDEDVGERVLELTDGVGADRVLDLNLSANAPLYDKILKIGGTGVIYGTDETTAALPVMAFVMRAPTLKWFIVYELDAPTRAAGVADLNAMLAAGSLTTTVAARFPLDDIVAAHDMVQEAAHIGNVVLDID